MERSRGVASRRPGNSIRKTGDVGEKDEEAKEGTSIEGRECCRVETAMVVANRRNEKGTKRERGENEGKHREGKVGRRRGEGNSGGKCGGGGGGG